MPGAPRFHTASGRAPVRPDLQTQTAGFIVPGMTDLLETSNLLGALVLAFHDEMRAATEEASGRSGESPPALVLLGQHPGLSIDALSRLLDLSHPGTVRLIDRLAAAGLVERRAAGHDRRAVALHLTASGEEARRGILSARTHALRQAVGALDGDDREALRGLLGKMLRNAAQDDTSKMRICRLCDMEACIDCPMASPAHDRAAG